MIVFLAAAHSFLAVGDQADFAVGRSGLPVVVARVRDRSLRPNVSVSRRRRPLLSIHTPVLGQVNGFFEGFPVGHGAFKDLLDGFDL